MQIEIRDTFINLGLSRSSVSFMTYLFVDGTLTATAHNRGNGQLTELTPAGEGALKIMTDAEKYCQETRPTWLRAGMLSVHLPATGTHLSEFVDMRVTRHYVQQRDEQMKTKLLYGWPEQKGYTEIPFTIDMDRFTAGTSEQKMLREFMRHTVIPMLNGRKIINTNLSYDLVDSLGIYDHVLYKPERKKKPTRTITGKQDKGNRQSPRATR